jgi:hypothetical protein
MFRDPWFQNHLLKPKRSKPEIKCPAPDIRSSDSSFQDLVLKRTSPKAGLTYPNETGLLATGLTWLAGLTGQKNPVHPANHVTQAKGSEAWSCRPAAAWEFRAPS